MKHISLAVALILSLAVTSCSVKEDRFACPGDIIVHFDKAYDYNKNVSVYLYDAYGDKVAAANYNDGSTDSTVFRMPKGRYTIAGVVTDRKAVIDGRYLTVRQGSQIDSVWAFTGEVTLVGESVDYDCSFDKQFSTVTVYNGASSADESDQFYGLDVYVTSRTSGFAIATLEPQSGNYTFTPTLNDDGSYAFRIPRQTDESLVFGVNVDGTPIEFPLGKTLKEVGYDFAIPSLNDISVGLNLVKLEVIIKIQGWTEEYIYKIFEPEK